ncbi:hypothetical protein MXB_1399, partial [Myxobolus squamalis]
NYQGLEEAVYRNIEACKRIADITRSSFGPNGMRKIVVNHLQKLFVTKDASTILKELEVEHPAAKIVVMAAQMTEHEVGDGTNFVIQFIASLMSGAGELLNYGVAPCVIIDGYKHALKRALDILPSLVCGEIKDIRDLNQVFAPIKSVVSTKQITYADHISNVVTNACMMSQPLSQNYFNVDNVRTIKILGSGGASTYVSQGFIIKTDVCGDVSEIQNAKIVVFNTDFDLMNTETKGTVLLNTAKELLSFSKGEEDAIKKVITDLKHAGCNVVVCSGKVADQALDYANRVGILIVRITSKFELQSFCSATQSISFPTILIPSIDCMGHSASVYTKEIGGTKVVIFSQEKEENAIATIIVRGSSDNVLDDLELSIDDGINCYKSLTMNGKLLPGAGATEISLCVKLDQGSNDCVGLDKHALSKFCDALKNTARCIAENNGLKANEVLAKLLGEHNTGRTNIGIDIESPELICDVVSRGIFDLLYVKTRCLQLAVDAATTLLSIDHIIVARPAGGPVPKQNPNWDTD